MKISIICTTFNRKAYLPDLLESFGLLRSEPFDVELEFVVYDDGSTDGTKELLEAQTDKRIKYFYSESNHGPSYGRNTAVSHATGDYLLIMDSDDVLLQRTIANFAREIEGSPEADMIIADSLWVDDDLKYLPGHDHFGWEFHDNAAVLKALFEGQHFIYNTFLVKKSAFLAVGGYDVERRIGEDLDIAVRILLKNFTLKYVPFISHLYRVHAGSLSYEMGMAGHMKNVKQLYRLYGTELAAFGISRSERLNG